MPASLSPDVIPWGFVLFSGLVLLISHWRSAGRGPGR